MDFEKLLIEFLRSNGIESSDAMLRDFISKEFKNLWQKYTQSRMDLSTMAANLVNDAGIRVPNGTKGAPFPENTIVLPAEFTRDYRFSGLDGLGLEVEEIDGHTFRIKGRPTSAGDYAITVSYDYEGRLEDEPRGETTFRLIINPDPRSLWKDIPTNPEIPFFKPDSATDYIKLPGRDVVAASCRGRSHANEGKPRDDDFGIAYLDQAGWYILAVCDGAGSATYSRKGAQLACQTVLDFCSRELSTPGVLEKAITDYAGRPADADEKSAPRPVYDQLYRILGGAALKAHKDISALASDCHFPLKDFSTTLLLTVCKKFDFGWFIGSYWVGDGAIAVYDNPSASVRIMGTPDEGEFSGQTRFLTMPDIFRTPQDIYSRLRFTIVPDFTAVVLMSDGVSDPMFETDKRLNSPDEWAAFFTRLREGFPDDGIPGVTLSDNDPSCAEQMLRWLGFWSKGNHDDRTLVILY